VTEEKITSSLPPETTAEEDRRTYGHRRINIMWEMTQSIVAVSVTLTTLGVSAYQIIQGRGAEGAFLLLSNVLFLVIGTYFQRTNHTKSSDRSEIHR
jgi:Co/Zn/Cd efflux system component